MNLIKRIKFSVTEFVCNDGLNSISYQQQYRSAVAVIKLLILLFIFQRIAFSMVDEPRNLKAHYVSVDAIGKPIGYEDLFVDRPEIELNNYFAKVMRKTFNLDNYSIYKSYRNTINDVNSRHFRLAWSSLNISENEFNSGFIKEGNESYMLVGQELLVMLIKSGIMKLLQKDEIKMWVKPDPSTFKITNIGTCDPEACLDDAKAWDITMKGLLYMRDLSPKGKTRYLPIKFVSRITAVSKMTSPDQLMIERLAITIGDK